MSGEEACGDVAWPTGPSCQRESSNPTQFTLPEDYLLCTGCFSLGGQGVNTRRRARVHTMSLEAICSFPFNQNLLLLCFLFCLVTEAKLHVPSRGS